MDVITTNLRIVKRLANYDMYLWYETKDIARRLLNFNNPRRNQATFPDVLTEYWRDNGKKRGGNNERIYLKLWDQFKQATEEGKTDPSLYP